MRVIFEEVDQEDFFEIILRPKEIDGIWKKGIVKDFPKGMYGKRNLNVFIRQETDLEHLTDEDEEFMPLVKGKKASTREGFSENVKREMDSGKKQDQAVAIAYSEARRGKKKPSKAGKKK